MNCSSSAASPVHQCVLQKWRDSVDVVFAHLSDVLEQEGQWLEHTVLYVELWHTVFVHESGQDSERGAGLSDDGDGHGCADTVLTLLDLQVIEKSGQDIVGAARKEERDVLDYIDEKQIVWTRPGVLSWGKLFESHKRQ